MARPREWHAGERREGEMVVVEVELGSFSVRLFSNSPLGFGRDASEHPFLSKSWRSTVVWCTESCILGDFGDLAIRWEYPINTCVPLLVCQDTIPELGLSGTLGIS